MSSLQQPFWQIPIAAKIPPADIHKLFIQLKLSSKLFRFQYKQPPLTPL